MNFRFSLLFFFLAAGFLTSCEDRPETLEEYLPRVETIVAEVLLNGNIQVKGRLVYEGFGDLYFAGFSMDSVPDPLISSNQILVNQIVGNEFTAEYDGSLFQLAAYERIYLKAFVVNEHGHASGNVLLVNGDDVGDPGIDVPCALDAGGADLGIIPGWQSFSSINGPALVAAGIYEATAALPSGRSVVVRYSDLTNGLYESQSSPFQIGENRIYIGLIINGQTYTLWDLSDVYVNQLNGSTFELVVCSATYGLGMLGNQSFKMRLQISV